MPTSPAQRLLIAGIFTATSVFSVASAAPLSVAGSPAAVMPIPAGGVTQEPGALEGDHLYRALMLRAAPGDLLEVIDLLAERLPTYASISEAGPFWMRHSQGDQWDLMVIFPMRSFAEYYSPDAIAARRRAFRGSGISEGDFQRQLAAHVAWQEDWFVWGPAPEVLAARFDGMSFFHVEIFLALPDKRDELMAQRRMENDYLERIGRQQNIIFTRAGGASWDLFTLGFYRDIKQYAESADIADDLQEQAAKAAGFQGAGFIGSYLRSLIAQHHDTLAVAIR